MHSRLLHALLDLFFPPRCICCRKPGTSLCPACLRSLPRLPRPLCPRCARVLDSRFCRHRHTFHALDRLDAACPFEGNVREAIHALKYERVRSLAVPLGTLLAEAPLIRAMPDAVIVPVPLHSTRFKERGFNQSELLAERLAGCAEMALVSDCLHRTRATAAQTHLNVNERVENVRDAFACRDHRFVGRRAILIDDVCTTGSTLEACAIALKADGATFVAGLTLARAGE